MPDTETVERREVPLAEWASAIAQARDAAYTFFDWLTAVDETDAEENPGFDIVCHLMDGSTPGALRRVLIRTRVPDGTPVPSITGIFARVKVELKHFTLDETDEAWAWIGARPADA